MMLELPYYRNEKGNECMQVAMKIVIKHFLNKDISIEELDELTGRKDEFWTWTFQGAVALDELGLNTKYYTSEEINEHTLDKEVIKKEHPKDYEKIIAKTDFSVTLPFLEKLFKSNIYKKIKFTVEEIEKSIDVGKIVIALIDLRIIMDMPEKDYLGHFVVITGYDEDNVYYHETGPFEFVKNKKLNKEIFNNARKPGDYDTIVVSKN